MKAPLNKGGVLIAFYTVQEGDTLTDIAQRFDTTVDALAEANPEIQDINVIFPGQTLCIPRWGIYVVQEGDNLTEIANNFNTTVDALVAANDIEDPDLIFEDQVLLVPFAETYTVQEGDNLTRIARFFGTTVDALVAANCDVISDPNLIRVGQVLAVPAGADVAPGLPLRTSEEIQGNVLSAFNKDHQVFLLLKFGDTEGARQWLGVVEQQVATVNQVETFNEEFSRARGQRGGDDPENLKAVWVNVGLTVDGLRTLSSDFQSLDSDLQNLGRRWRGFEAFRHKPRDDDRAQRLGDTGDSAPAKWVFGGPNQPDIDAVLTVAADTPGDLQNRVSRLQQIAASNRVVTVFLLDGETLPGVRKGHEHFGFKDGISQPGVRQFHRSVRRDGEEEREGHPGTEMVQLGEFVLGYEDEHDRDEDLIPAWMRDGSFQVLRRLKQDVPDWWAQMQQAQTHNIAGGPDRLAAKVVGRWRSGTPLAHAPDRDNRSTHQADDDNDFKYDDDPSGEKTPRFAHIRKTYPRDERFQDDRHRIMRRGIPFGQPFDPASGRGGGRDAERGLIFNAHCADIAEQFEFLQEVWTNNVNFQQSGDGPDSVIGIDGSVTLHEGGSTQQLGFRQFVTTTGAVYAFAPSKSTLRQLADGDR